MATIDATVGGASANSYLTIAAGDTYFEGRLDAAEWTAAATATLTSALMMATARLEQERLVGVPTTTTQALQWPRAWAPEVTGSGAYYEDDEIPEPVERACAELALALLKDNTLLRDTGLEGFAAVSLGPMRVTPRAGSRGGDLPAQVKRLLKGLRIATGAQGTLVRG